MKRIIALISAIALSLSFAAFAVSAENETITYVVNGMNSYRAVDMLIVYNTAGTTGTNEWGYEVTVGKNGKVTSVGGNNKAGAGNRAGAGLTEPVGGGDLGSNTDCLLAAERVDIGRAAWLCAY